MNVCTSDGETNRDHSQCLYTELKFSTTHNYYSTNILCDSSVLRYCVWWSWFKAQQREKNLDLFVMGSDWAVSCIDYVSLRTFCCASPNVMRGLSASEINPITICKCYSCFSNRPGQTLKACIYIHTHEPDPKLNADACDQWILKSVYNTFHKWRYLWMPQSKRYLKIRSENIFSPVAAGHQLYPLFSHGHQEFAVLYLKGH